jgi:hypothetical protein
MVLNFGIAETGVAETMLYSKVQRVGFPSADILFVSLGVMFTSLLDLYGASRSCHEVLDELIPEVSLSTLKPCIDIKLQNRHARMNVIPRVLVPMDKIQKLCQHRR